MKMTDFENITKNIMLEYEAIRQMGVSNMFDFDTVTNYANQFDLYDLASLEAEEYYYILGNFGKLMSHFSIDQETPWTELLTQRD